MVVACKNLLYPVLALFCVFASSAVFSCDDTLIVLLTARNPKSEFAKTIRKFNTDLSILGTALKEGKKNNYQAELNNVMKSWLDFSKTYMTNPPEEAKNDRNWVKKTSHTAKIIGEIRQDTLKGNYYEAHNKVLGLSGYLGKFFEAFGVSAEKQIFVTVSDRKSVV